jgi:hypothetical protein
MSSGGLADQAGGTAKDCNLMPHSFLYASSCAIVETIGRLIDI